MVHTARAVLPFLAFALLPVLAAAQTGPSDPQIIASATMAKANVGNRKLAGHVIATVRVGQDGRVRDVLVTENTTEPGLEPQLVRVLNSARFRPAIDATGKLVESSIEMKVELRSSTGDSPKPIAAKPDPALNDKEKARIRKMRCSDYVWEWDFIREEGSTVATEFMPRIATTMYAAMRSEAGDVVDSKVWKVSAKALKEAADQCRDNPSAPFFDGIFKTVMDAEVAD